MYMLRWLVSVCFFFTGLIGLFIGAEIVIMGKNVDMVGSLWVTHACMYFISFLGGFGSLFIAEWYAKRKFGESDPLHPKKFTYFPREFAIVVLCLGTGVAIFTSIFS